MKKIHERKVYLPLPMATSGSYWEQTGSKKSNLCSTRRFMRLAVKSRGKRGNIVYRNEAKTRAKTTMTLLVNGTRFKKKMIKKQYK